MIQFFHKRIIQASERANEQIRFEINFLKGVS